VDTKRLDLNLLITLDALLSERNVTRAATRLHLSQPAVSAQLARLRDVFADPLLLPVQRGMIPTAKALELHEPLRLALDQVRAVVVQNRVFNPAKAKLTVSVAASDYVQYVVLQRFILDLRARAPGVRFALRAIDASSLMAQMESGGLDIALITPDAAPATLRSRTLYEEHYVVIARRGHPKLKRKLTVEQFAALEHVVVSPRGGSFSTPVDAALLALGHKRSVVLSAASFLFVPRIVAQSDLVALVPSRLVAATDTELQVQDCPFPVNGFSMTMVWHERNHDHAGQRWVRDELICSESSNTNSGP
jgi:DNA-binding transcriptional LysR family regulator